MAKITQITFNQLSI